MHRNLQQALLASLILVIGCNGSSHIDVIAETNIFETGQILPVEATVNIGDTTLELEIARTPAEQSMGLMFRQSLPINRGMLFPFDEKRFTQFWMFNVNFPLDMVFLNGGKIVAIERDVPPCEIKPCPTYGPPILVDAVLELAGGQAAELGLKTKQTLTINYVQEAR